MPARSFAHLHCHSHYSLLDGASRVPELIAQTKALGMNAVALTDHGNLYGAIEFYREATAAGVNPVIGYEAYIAPGARTEKAARRQDAYYHLTLLAKDRTGFRNLIKMASAAFLEGYSYAPRIDKELLAAHKEGLICLSGCLSGEFNWLLLRDQQDKAKELAEWFARTFGDDFYIEIQHNGMRAQDQCTEAAADIAARVGRPLVATADAHYLCKGDAVAHDVLLCINTGAKRSDEKRMRYGDDKSAISDQYYVRSPEDMYRLFPRYADAVQRSQEIADGVAIQLDFKTRHFPKFAPPAEKTPEEYLRELCVEGLRERYPAGARPEVLARLEHELGIICRMGFASYFLIVWDFVRFAREKNIPASARGSACGAMVSYLLQLSHVDPLEYDLLFERFLDPNRSEAPDIDIDFCQDRREEVIAYVRQKYGEQSVAQITTFGTLAAKAAIKDVGRVLDIPLDRVLRMTALVPTKLGSTIDDALEQSPEFKREYDLDPAVREWIDIARKLEGTNRNAGTHAAGVVIASGPITDHVPVHRVVRKGDDAGSRSGEAVVATQWVMGDLEKVGLLKMDFLGLRTLTVLDNAVRLIRKTRGEEIDLYRLPLDDAPTYKLLQRGDAKGVFQFESEGIRELLKRLKPDRIGDIIAGTALYRPGPLQGGLVDSYVNRKHGREKAEYLHPVMEAILGDTHGVMVFQEQVMLILNRLGGIELSSAYACIKAISKKKHDIIEQRGAEFVAGARQRGLSEQQAKEIFDLIVFFGGYGFNRSHSAAYAVVTYQTAYLKTHYPAEFMAALLSSEIDDGNKRDILVEHIADARKLGVEVLPPDVNGGEPDFSVAGGKIVFGLTAIKGLGRGAAEELVRARREKGPFVDLYDFCERVNLKSLGKAAIEKLIKAGAFDGFGNRQQLFAALPQAVRAAEAIQDDRRKGHRSIFDLMDDAAAEAGVTARTAEPLPQIEEWTVGDKLKFEKEALGFYLSSHPLAQFEQDLKRYATHAAEQIPHLDGGQEVTLGGMIAGLRFHNTKKARNGNTRYVRCKLEDLTGEIECVMWPDDYVLFKDAVVEDRPCFVKGEVERNQERPSLRLTRVFDIETARRELTTGLVLVLRLGQHGPETLSAAARVLRRVPGPCPVYLDVLDQAGRHAKLRLGSEYRVMPGKVHVGELEDLLGRGCVVFTGK